MKLLPMFLIYRGMLFFLLLSSCSFTHSEASIPDIGLASGEINSRFKIEALPELNNFRTDDAVQLVITALEGNVIEFSPGFDARLFQQENEEWIEIENLFGFSPPENIILPSNNPPPNNFKVTSVYPEIKEVNKHALVRIVLIGHVVKDGKVTDQKTAAYVDVLLEP